MKSIEVFFHKLTVRNWGAPWHFILVLLAVQSFISIFNVQNLEHPGWPWLASALLLLAIVYETWQRAKKAQSLRATAEDMVMNIAGFMAGIFPFLF